MNMKLLIPAPVMLVVVFTGVLPAAGHDLYMAI